MTRSEEIELEIHQQAVRLYPKCAALFELPLMVYAQIMEDNTTRKRPYRVSVRIPLSSELPILQAMTKNRYPNSP